MTANIDNSKNGNSESARLEPRNDRFTLANIEEIDSMAARIAHKRARFHSQGGCSLVLANGKHAGERIQRAQAAQSKRKVRAVIRNGTGGELDRQAIEEMTLAARAALIESAITGESKFSAIKAASKAAASELHHATRETVFDDLDKARRANDRAFNLARESWETSEPQAAQSQPHCAEFLADDETESLNPRAVIARGLRRARRAIRAAYAAKHYPRSKMDCARDLKSLRDLARKIETGIARQAARDDMAEYMHLRRLEERAQAGFAIIAQTATPKTAFKPRAFKPQAARVVSLPVGRVETWLADFRLGMLPIARRIIDRAPAESLRDLASWEFSMR